jgi:ribosomal protein L35AE/L33A
MKTDLKVGDSVYWRMRVGMFSRTLSGKITKIEGNTAMVEVHTQNIYGAEYKKKLSTLTKNLKQ